uniref:hypothetical protein n=1 Tax=Raoultella ornithinolytica TaxID=54291 RepID=UPI002739AEF9|nr:hypothetical protein [Raoultella ornithinolytica]WLP22445.1 hypothetical protein Q8726_03055 [Raoultella ornithinolytica]
MKEHPDKHIRAAIDYTLVQRLDFSPWRQKRPLFWPVNMRYGPSSGAYDEHLEYTCGTH